MGSVLAAVGLFVLIMDERFAPWYPGCFLLLFPLTIFNARELLGLLGPKYKLPSAICLAGTLSVIAANWIPHLWQLKYYFPEPVPLRPLSFVLLAFVIFFLTVFLREIFVFQESNGSILRIALSTWIVVYLAVLPSFLVQLRWLPDEKHYSTVALIMAVFVPKCCDIGAFFTGRYLGRTKMAPTLSPKKTWEGAFGGLLLAVLVTIVIDRVTEASPLGRRIGFEIAFGISVGGFAILGDLAESLIKRDCQQKDSSQAVPGFGGVLDVIDAVLFAAPVSFIWLSVVSPPTR